ncbi:MAG TPA: helix-turn-helix domain-containing protein [Alloprevotella sp.]|nr:helix-turn-helix domain-containing protein [Alloprevotella sp.]
MNTENPKKTPAYRTRLNATRSDQLYVDILNRLTKGRRYRDPQYTARQLATDLNTNTRYISAAIALHTGSNYNVLVNGLRLRDAENMLRSPRYAGYTVEEIGLMAGFASRQSFYTAFRRVYATTPLTFRRNLQNHE